MKKVVGAVLALLLVFALAGCDLFGNFDLVNTVWEITDLKASGLMDVLKDVNKELFGNDDPVTWYLAFEKNTYILALEKAGQKYLVAQGDYSADSKFIEITDDWFDGTVDKEDAELKIANKSVKFTLKFDIEDVIKGSATVILKKIDDLPLSELKNLNQYTF